MSPRITWSRPEPFGAWVRIDDAPLLAVDRALADRLGVPRGDAAGQSGGGGGGFGGRAPEWLRPLELHIAVTSRCYAPCDGCYMDAHPEGEEPPLDVILERLSAARAAGVSTVAFGGGEPLLREDLGEIAGAARALGLVPVMTTSGFGLTAERARGLRAFAQINVSHDGAQSGYRDVRGFDGRGPAERAIELLRDAGIPTGVNVVLTRATFDLLPATAERVRDLGAREIQLLRYKPGGRAADPSYEGRRLTPAQIEALWPAIERLVLESRLHVRIDCALVPLLSAALLARVVRPAETLAALGVFGCEAARHLGGMRVDGALAPCSFFSAAPGRARALGPRDRDRSPTPRAPRALPILAPDDLERFRAYHASPPEPCRSCELFSVCRGGCQVVSRYIHGHKEGALAPDPECPKVALSAAEAAP
jgi:radical SAM protein with 4Fe4S-binding SPASM domain